MIISASRRTDIPAFYGAWFMNRIRAGHCEVINPFNQNQVARVSLKPEDVDVIVFWTRHGLPMFRHLKELDARGYHYYFLYTVMNNPRSIDPKSPPLETSLRTFCELAERVGSERVIWRYDPIFLTTATPVDFHLKTYQQIAQRLRGFTNRSIISLATIYRKVKRRLEALRGKGVELVGVTDESMEGLMKAMSQMAHESDMEIFSCAQEVDFSPCGIHPGSCIDSEYIEKVLGVTVTRRKDPSQRNACGCVVSRDIGAYDTCLFNCSYCYATTSFDRAKASFKKHDPNAPSLV